MSRAHWPHGRMEDQGITPAFNVLFLYVQSGPFDHGRGHPGLKYGGDRFHATWLGPNQSPS